MIETIILSICLALTGAGLVLALRSDLPFIRNPARRARAVIVRYHRRTEDGAPVFTPVFRFKDRRGREIEVRDKVYTPFETPVPGEIIEIVYPEGTPEKARIPYPVFRALVYAVLGYVFVVLGMKVTGLG